MLDSLYAKLGGLALLLALLVGGYLYAHHRGAVSQQAVDAPKFRTLATALTRASAQLSLDVSSFDEINRKTRRELAGAAIEQQAADTAVAAAKQTAAKALAKQAVWQSKFEAASKSDPCAKLMEQSICPAVFEH